MGIYDKMKYIGTFLNDEDVEIPMYETVNTKPSSALRSFTDNGTFPNDGTGIPPSLGGVHGSFIIVPFDLSTGQGRTPGGLTLKVILSVVDTYGPNWIKVRYEYNNGQGVFQIPVVTPPWEGWINTQRPELIYINQ